MKICILGAGSLGSTFSGLLTEGGLDVCLLARRLSPHVETVKRQGLTLVEGPEERTVKVRVATDSREIGPVDLIVVLVKSYSTREAMDSAVPLIGEETLALSLQNGLGHEEILAEYVGRGRVLGGKTYVGGMVTSPGRVVIGRKGRPTYIGEWDGKSTKRVNRISDLMSRAGMDTPVSSDIRSVIWKKLLINVSTGAITGITRLPYGNLMQVKEAVDCAIAAVAEAIAVGRADGVDLTDDPRAVLKFAVEGLPSDFKTSMLQDIEKGSRTEIDFINGAVVRLGEKFGIPTPVNRTFVAGIKGIEFGIK
jgi:2-dehydropantoate 2-reductase